jgi:spore cortex formation protein SpoVR/YcgB (stage V sporulation)
MRALPPALLSSNTLCSLSFKEINMSSDTDTTAELDRENIIRLLNQLGSDKDEEILTSARALHAQIKGADADWHDLLVGEEAEAEPEPEAEAEAEDTEEPEQEKENTDDNKRGKKLSDADALIIIDKLLSKEGISEYLKEELEDYKEDISEGEFEASDRNYLISLNKRLS